MIGYSIIQKSQLERANRIDAEYYQPEYLKLILKIKSQNSKSLEDLGNVAYGTTPEEGAFEECGVPFVRSQNFSNLMIDTSDIVFCSKEFHNQNKKSAIKPGDILFAAVGATIGELAIVQNEIKEGNINQNIARVRIVDKNVNPYFIGFFFASESGQLQIERLITGNAQPYLNSEQIKAFVIPILDKEKQNEIGKYFQEIQTQIELSKSLYSQAENLLLEELELKNFAVEDDLSFVVNLSDVKSVGRINAEYFQPKYEKLIKRLGKTRILSSMAVRKIAIAKINLKKEYNYIEISDINVGTGEAGFNRLSGKDLPASAKLEISGGELIISKVRPTRGAVSVIPENWSNNFVVSNAFSIYEVNSPQREYLQVILRSIIGILQLEKPTTGTSYPTITDFDVEKILIPMINIKTQQKIADLVQKSHEARKKSKELLEEAKRKVEEMIEKSRG